MLVKIKQFSLEAIQGNIANQPDMIAIVNAANAELRSGSGVAGAIHHAAGSELENACASLSPIRPGDAVITQAYHLPNQYVIHCLGPIYGIDKPEDKILASCYRNTLILAESKHIHSIAFPAISTGVFGYPMQLATKTALQTIYQMMPTLNYVKHIRFVLFSSSDYEIYKKELTSIFDFARLDFVANSEVLDTEEAIVAGGCFWGVDYYLRRLPGVLKTEVGYTGGHKENPTYDDVCRGLTGHVEAVRVIYDPKKISYDDLLRHFFEIHDPTQKDGQGPDIGNQYLSIVFYFDTDQKIIAEKLIHLLQHRGYVVATKLLPISVFWPAETYHQRYYEKTGKKPYCHSITKRF